jgi:hypothetical protein
MMLRDLGYDLIAADSPNSFLEDTPTANLIRQILGAVSQFEKASLVAKLKGARDRKRRETENAKAARATRRSGQVLSPLPGSCTGQVPRRGSVSACAK